MKKCDNMLASFLYQNSNNDLLCTLYVFKKGFVKKTLSKASNLLLSKNLTVSLASLLG